MIILKLLMVYLSKRQCEILKYLYNHSDHYTSATLLSEVFSVSSRTILSDLKYLRKCCDRNSGLEMTSIPNKGSAIKIIDRQLAFKSFPFLKSAESVIVDDRTYQAEAIIFYLLSCSFYVSKTALTEKFYLSESSIYTYFKIMSSILNEYNLKLEKKSNIGYRISGAETDKRLFILRHQYLNHYGNFTEPSEELSKVYSVVLDSFIAFKYQADEQTLQNITSHVILAIQRIRNGFIINAQTNTEISSEPLFLLSQRILSSFLAQYNLDKKQFDAEAESLTYMIMGKVSWTSNPNFQSDINRFINRLFEKINQTYCINLFPFEDIKIALSMHLASLYYRAKSGSSITNSMSGQIKQSFILANDIASYFAEEFSKAFKISISADEISFLSLYFNYALEKNNLNHSGKRIIILSSLRKSETILLQHRIFSWFPSQVSEILVCNPNELNNIDTEQYDLLFCTEDVKEKTSLVLPTISIFPDAKDFDRINTAINGNKDINDLLDKFSEECFFYGHAENKEEVLKIVCRQAENKYELPEGFYDAILEHEDLSNSYFVDKVAIPHPLTPLSEETFASVAILDKPVEWGNGNNARFIILVSIEKNNPLALRFWYTISKLLQNKNAINKILQGTTYSYFIKCIEESLLNE